VAAAVVAILAVLLVLGLTGNDGGGESGPTAAPTTTTTAKKKPAKKPAKKARKAPARPRTVALRIVPAGPTYVCIDKGSGTDVVYEGTLEGPKSWKARHLRLNLGRRAVRITVNGKRVPVPKGSDPVGFDFRPAKRSLLPSGQRPCA
jgi:hypothetical protein